MGVSAAAGLLLLADAGAALLMGAPGVRHAARAPLVMSDAGLKGDFKPYYKDKLCDDDECELPGSDEFCVAILGDLHLDPRKMEDYYTGRDHFLPILEDAKSRGVSTVLCSLGDLGESKSVRPKETQGRAWYQRRPFSSRRMKLV